MIVINKTPRVIENSSEISMESGDSNDCETSSQNNRAEEMAAAAAVVLSLQSTMVTSLQQAAMLPINSPAATALNLQALESYFTLQRLSCKSDVLRMTSGNCGGPLPSLHHFAAAASANNQSTLNELSTIKTSDLVDDEDEEMKIIEIEDSPTRVKEEPINDEPPKKIEKIVIDDDDDDFNKKIETSKKIVKPASPELPKIEEKPIEEEEEDDDVDPLDAYMKGVDEEVRKINKMSKVRFL